MSTPTPNDVLDAKVIQNLRELAGDDEPNLLVEIVDMFLTDAPERMREIDRALAAGDVKALERASHTLKSSAANVGALGLADLCKRIEEIARASSTAGVSQLVAESNARWPSIADALRALKD